MPSSGFKSITVSDETYGKLEKYLKAHKEELGNLGVFSVAGLCVEKMEEYSKDRIKLLRIANKIIKFPQTCRIYVGAQ